MTELQGKCERNIILIGHTTGCQDILWMLGGSYIGKSWDHGLTLQQPPVAAILQGAVSDREYFIENHSQAEMDGLLHWCAENKEETIHFALFDD